MTVSHCIPRRPTKRHTNGRRVGITLLALGLVSACSTEEAVNPYPDASAAVFTKNSDTGRRDLPAVPELPTPTSPGAKFTLDGLWSGTAITNDPTHLTCAHDPGNKSQTYTITTPIVGQFSGVANYPTADYYSLSVFLFDRPQSESGVERTAQVVVGFADSTGTYVQMAAPEPNSVVVQASDDRSAVSFSMINVAADKRNEGSPTTVVGTITCPAP